MQFSWLNSQNLVRIAIVAVLILATVFVAVYLPTYKALDFLAILLCMLAGIYVGFSFADGRTDKIIIELAFALTIGASALLAMWKWLWLIPLGYSLMCGWSLWHHFSYHGARVKAWFAPMGALYCAGLMLFISFYFFF